MNTLGMGGDETAGGGDAMGGGGDASGGDAAGCFCRLRGLACSVTAVGDGASLAGGRGGNVCNAALWMGLGCATEERAVCAETFACFRLVLDSVDVAAEEVAIEGPAAEAATRRV